MSRVIRETLHHGDFYKVTDTPLAEGYIPTSEDVREAMYASPYRYGTTMTRAKLEELTRELDEKGRMGHGWSWFDLVDVPDVPAFVRAVCSCGYFNTDPDELEAWNGYGEHAGQDGPGRHAVSVWTLSDGRVVIADQRTEEQK